MHAITVRKDKHVDFAYAPGVSRWHGLGNETPVDAPFAVWQKNSGLDYKIESSFVRYLPAAGANVMTFNKYVTLFRSDNKQPLAIVSSKFKVFQPAEVLKFCFDIAEAGGFQMHTAGSLFDGVRVWSLAKVNEGVVSNGDLVNGFLLIATACDGSLKTTIDFVTECVVCNNTLNMALGQKSKHRIEISHRSKFNAQDVKAKLNIAQEDFDKFIAAAKVLSQVKLSDRQAAQFIAKLLVTQNVADEEKKPITENKHFMSIMGLFRGNGLGAKLDGRAHTAWGAVNAVTEYVDHRTRAKTDSHRLNNAWFGQGDTLKTAALETAINELV